MPPDAQPTLLTPQCVAILAGNALSGGQHQVFWSLAVELRSGTEVVSLTSLAERLMISRMTTVNAVHKLLRLGLLVRGARVGSSYQYKLNPAFIRVL